jgi:hypothetical protein
MSSWFLDPKFKFRCVKQPANSTMGAYYTILYMQAFMQDQHIVLLPESMQKNGARTWRTTLTTTSEKSPFASSGQLPQSSSKMFATRAEYSTTPN